MSMLRTAGRSACHFSRKYCRSLATPAPSCSRLFSTEGGGKGRLVEVSTKDEYLNFPRDKSVLYFTAKWCPPCRRIGPFFAELSEETPSVSFGKVDIDLNMDAAKMAGIVSVPTFKFFKGGKEIHSILGADADLVENLVAKVAE